MNSTASSVSSSSFSCFQPVLEVKVQVACAALAAKDGTLHGTDVPPLLQMVSVHYHTVTASQMHTNLAIAVEKTLPVLSIQCGNQMWWTLNGVFEAYLGSGVIEKSGINLALNPTRPKKLRTSEGVCG